MKTYHPDILPFNIAVVKNSELKNLKEFTDCEGNKISIGENVLGAVVKAIHNDSENGRKACYSMIVFRDTPNVNTIAHEAFHSACDLLESVGIDYTHYGSNEVYAYMIGYIVDCINDALNKDKVWE